MLQSLTLRNFQAHRKLVLELDPGITMITGRTDIGKSAIIRALYWLVFNRPEGSKFISWGQDRVLVGLKLDDKRIRRVRTKTENLYLLEAHAFTAFGNEVPGEIQQALKLGEVNFQQQYDPPFWLQDTAGAVARQLNQVVDLGIIDRSLAHLAQAVRQARSNLEVTEQRLEEAKQRLQDSKWAEAFDSDLQQLERVAAEGQQTRRQCHQLAELIATARTLEKEAEFEAPDFSALDSLLIACDKQAQMRRRLSTLVNEAECAIVAKNRAIEAARLAEGELHRHTKGKCPVCGSPLP